MVKQVIVMRKDLHMRKGKIAAQAAHASVAAIKSDSHIVERHMDNGSHICTDLVIHMDMAMEEWFENSFTKICVYVESQHELMEIYGKAKKENLTCALITDNGTTEFNGVPTITCCAIGPEDVENIDKITGHLPLY